ncbi:3-phosphoshikimate 1-carboxyvinyltransferase [Sporanaerobium hydrogeniformans]|uniref:3-phosphoshikimate 1-carboxyvinyltransferase n=1 Tax=Sporanaerobium hydrogeniformans TaxID=3072179 RepID=A0AC61DGU7_9FIRM|nr:3-phosphoshikimate 1-carboxyvinyltransferase [Sporanaerobium hydrogeniformans]PHV71597.1 3-phosphoshikimate 1-carboxyvinyltransferase [Sporanaerobium hydrogeniformans]
MLIKPHQQLRGSLSIPSDKSISHRSVMFGSLAKGETIIHNFLMGDDCLSTIHVFRQLGISITLEKDTVYVKGKGLHGLSAPLAPLDCGNSGTTVRLLSGILSAQSFSSTLTGDASIQKRPMARVITPLRQMKATLSAKEDRFCPLHIEGGHLEGIHYVSPVASAQVKSCILLAGLYASSPTTVTEPFISRDHTERMLEAFGAKVTRLGTSVTISPCEELYPCEITVPGDISSAAFFMVAGLITPNSDLTIRNVGINPTRRGILDVLLEMGGDIKILNERLVCGEPVCDLRVRTSSLHGVTIEGATIPTLIDEIPVLAVAACFAKGKTLIKDASELRVKECDRIVAIHTELSKMGGAVLATEDGLIIEGGKPLHGATLETYHDHRMAMALTIAALNATSPSQLLGEECVRISFPNFFELLAELS